MVDGLTQNKESPKILYEQSHRLLSGIREKMKEIENSLSVTLSNWEYSQLTFS